MEEKNKFSYCEEMDQCLREGARKIYIVGEGCVSKLKNIGMAIASLMVVSPEDEIDYEENKHTYEIIEALRHVELIPYEEVDCILTEAARKTHVELNGLMAKERYIQKLSRSKSIITMSHYGATHDINTKVKKIRR